jgi:hypothetical protein
MKSNQPAQHTKSHFNKNDEERLAKNLERVKSFGSEKDLMNHDNIGSLV